MSSAQRREAAGSKEHAVSLHQLECDAPSASPCSLLGQPLSWAITTSLKCTDEWRCHAHPAWRGAQGHKGPLTSNGLGRSPNFLAAELACCVGAPCLPEDTPGTEQATASKTSFCMVALARPIWARASAAASLLTPQDDGCCGWTSATAEMARV